MSFPALLKDSSNIPISSAYIPNGNFVALQASTNTTTDTSGNTSAPALLSLAASNSTSGTLQNSQTGSANGTAFSVLGYAAIAFTVTMTGFTGTVTFKGSEDGTNYDPINVIQSGTSIIGTSVTGSTTTSIHIYYAECIGLQSVESVTSGVSAGNVTITAHALPVNLAPRVVNLGGASASTITSVNAAASDTSLLASNTSRKAAYFYNDSTAILYLSFGSTTASTTSYTVQIPAGSFFEMAVAPVFTGAMRGIWSAANGAVRITELS